MRQLFIAPLQHRLVRHGIPVPVVEFAIGAAFALVMGGLRLTLVPLMGDRAPFAFAFVAVGCAALLAGWRSGLWALVLGQSLTAFAFLEPRWVFALVESEVRWAVLFSTLAQGFLLLMITLYQAELRRAWAARDRSDKGRILLVRELNHRVKNTLAVVQSLAANTFRDTDPRAVRAFEGRLQALASAHDLLTRQNWSASPIADIIHLAVAPFRPTESDPFSLDGPEARLGSQQAITLVLALHELATNAGQYGALSVPGGKVAIRWDVGADRAFALTWHESDGPPVSESAKTGFGMRMVKSVLARQFEAQVALRMDGTGLVCSIDGRLEPAARD